MNIQIPFNYFLSHRLFTASYSGFIPGDFVHCATLFNNSLNSNCFDNHLTVDVGCVFLDISKALNKIWHDGLLFELKPNVAEGQLFYLLES